jgi:sugar phosphate isomerase/epimerase
MTAGGPRLGLIVRLYTATDGRPDEDAESPSAAWLATKVTIAQFRERLGLAASVGATGIEVTQGQQRSGCTYLLGSPTARDELLGMLSEEGLTISALNAAGMPLHPVRGPEHQALFRDTVRLAELLGVRKIVSMSGVGGDGPGSTTVNWGFFPWPDDLVALTERQWTDGIALWRDLAAFAGDHAVERIALELHPLHLVYNVPTLERLREAVGPVIGANVDPSHLFWQSMDPVAVVRTLGPAVHHVQLKDTQIVPEQVAIAGVLDGRPFSDPSRRAWVQRTIGRAHDAASWQAFLDALTEVGYDGFASIENEDPYQTYEEGVREAAAFLRPLLGMEVSSGS